MFYYTYKDGFTIIKRHLLLFVSWYFKFIFFLLVSILLYIISVDKLVNLSEDMIYLNYIVYFLILVFINYAFFRLILTLIDYYHNLIIIKNDQIIIIECSLLLKDDIEIIDSYRIMKIDAFSHWFFANILSYWKLVIEQQRDEVRICHFVPNPYFVLNILRKQKQEVIDDRRKKYILNDQDTNKSGVI